MSREYTAVALVTLLTCLASTDLPLSGRPNFEVQLINVDFIECVDSRLCAVFGAFNTFLKKAEPSAPIQLLLPSEALVTSDHTRPVPVPNLNPVATACR